MVVAHGATDRKDWKQNDCGPWSTLKNGFNVCVYVCVCLIHQPTDQPTDMHALKKTCFGTYENNQRPSPLLCQLFDSCTCVTGSATDSGADACRVESFETLIFFHGRAMDEFRRGLSRQTVSHRRWTLLIYRLSPWPRAV